MHGTIEISSQVNQGTTTRMKFHFEIAKESELEKINPKYTYNKDFRISKVIKNKQL